MLRLARFYNKQPPKIHDWNKTEVITDRKSRFQGQSVDLYDPKDINEILGQFLAEHKSTAKNASHPHIYAWRTGTIKEVEEVKKKKKITSKEILNLQQGFNDNGEKGAGEKLLEQLIRNNVVNKLVFVTRWYGGSPIGSLRFRHICNCGLNSLRQHAK